MVVRFFFPHKESQNNQNCSIMSEAIEAYTKKIDALTEQVDKLQISVDYHKEQSRQWKKQVKYVENNLRRMEEKLTDLSCIFVKASSKFDVYEMVTREAMKNQDDLVDLVKGLKTEFDEVKGTTVEFETVGDARDESFVSQQSSVCTELRDFIFETGDRARVKYTGYHTIGGSVEKRCDTGEIVDVSNLTIKIMLDDHSGTLIKLKDDCALIKKHYMIMNDGWENDE